MDKVMLYSDAELKSIVGSGKYIGRKEDLEKSLFKYLSKYHSDQRWIVKTYPHDSEKKIFIHDFKGSTFYYENVNGLTVLIYNTDAHEYFYGRFNAEHVHAFCHIIGSWNKKGLRA